MAHHRATELEVQTARVSTAVVVRKAGDKARVAYRQHCERRD